MGGSRWPRRRGARFAMVAALAVSLLGAGVVVGAVASPAIKTFTPRSANQITNIDVLRQQIRNYYGDPLGTGVFAPDGNYAKEAMSVAVAAQRWLAAKAVATHSHGHWGGRDPSGIPAIVLDVDDTTLATWNYEIASNWAYNPTSNATYVTGELFPPVPGMVAMVNKAAAMGYAVIFITGRPASQEAVTLGNLTSSDSIGLNAGYPMPASLNDHGTTVDGLFTKPDVADYPQYLTDACANDPGGKCTTIHYKSATRAYIESLGYDIVASFGDQYSDLTGGYADRTFKMPNPNYYLP